MRDLNNYSDDQLKEELEKRGYQTHNLWKIEDVKSNYVCDDEEAMEILIEALTNEATMNQIWFAIDFHASDMGLTKKQTDE